MDTKEYKLTLKFKINEATGQMVYNTSVILGKELPTSTDFETALEEMIEKFANSAKYHLDRIK